MNKQIKVKMTATEAFQYLTERLEDQVDVGNKNIQIWGKMKNIMAFSFIFVIIAQIFILATVLRLVTLHL